MITISAPAKINLYLHILGRQEDGFHDIESLVVFTKISDVINVKASETMKFEISGPFRDCLGEIEKNLVYRAAQTLKCFFDISCGAQITLKKNLPVASGLGGGSSDAAATIRALAELWGINFNLSDFLPTATKLGADVPVCLFGQAALVSGVGDRIHSIKGLPHSPIVLLNPRIELSTKKVFRAFHGPYSKSLSFEKVPKNTEELVNFLTKGRGNDLKKTAVKLAPEIDEVLSFFKQDPKCRFANMSGSGATCFGIYDDFISANAAVNNCSIDYPSWWSVCTELASFIEKPNIRHGD